MEQDGDFLSGITTFAHSSSDPMESPKVYNIRVVNI